MKIRSGLMVLLAGTSFHCEAEDHFFSVETLLASKEVKAVLRPDIKLYWGSQPTPELVEQSEKDDYSGKNYQVNFHSTHDKCMRAFATALEHMITDAHVRGYDAIVNLRAADPAAGSVEEKGLLCDRGFRSTWVALSSSFAVTRDAFLQQEMRAKDPAHQAEKQAQIANYRPAENVVVIPLADILDSPEAKAIIGDRMKVFPAALPSPKYVKRFGPIDHSNDAKISTYGREGACKEAALLALKDMVDEAREDGYDAIINLRSRLNDKLVPDEKLLECEAGKRSAEVVLFGSFVSLEK